MSEKNFKARTKYSFKFVMVYKDETGTPIDLTGMTVEMQIRQADDTLVTDVDGLGAITVTNASGGEITVHVPPATTTNWPVETLYYDIKLINGTEEDALLYGSIDVSKGVTD